MANIDKISVKNTVFNIVSPAVVSDYIEVIGGACTKPDGYEEDEVILAKQNDVQLLFKATQDIAFGANIVENTNCVRTTLEEVLKNAGGGGGASSADQVSYDNSASGLEAENVQEAIDEVQGNVVSVNQTLTNYANSQSNPNLLDNPFFTVNQRGQSQYVGNNTAKQYTFDRWSMAYVESDITVTANADGTITFDNDSSVSNRQLQQNFETFPLSGKVGTLSIDVVSVTNKVDLMVALDDSPYTTYLSITDLKVGINKATIQFPDLSSYATGKIKVSLILRANASVTFKAIKLELGSVSTLAQDTAPNYATELLKCQRYFVRLEHASLGMGFTQIANSVSASIPIPVPMRTIPTISVSGDVGLVATDGTVYHPFTGATSWGENPISVVGCDLTGVTIPANIIGRLYSAASAYIDFSADL